MNCPFSLPPLPPERKVDNETGTSCFCSSFAQSDIIYSSSSFRCFQYSTRIASNPVRVFWLRPTVLPSDHICQYIVGSFACIGGGLFGLDISSMSGVLSVRISSSLSSDYPLTVRRHSRTRRIKGRSAIRDPMLKVPLSRPCPQVPSLELSWSPSWQMFWGGDLLS